MSHSISADEIAALKSSGQFDEQWYCERYPDVRASGMDPAAHYLWIGQRLGRLGRASAVVEIGQSGGAFKYDALFVDGTNGTSSTPYRVFRVAHGLADLGWNVHCIKGEDLFHIPYPELSARIIVVHRAPYWSPFVEFVQSMRSMGCKIVYDIDDLVFDEDVIPCIDGYKYLDEDGRAAFHRGLHAYRSFIINADFCTSTTDFLVKEMARLGKRTAKIKNAISTENIAYYKQNPVMRRVRPSPFVIGYYSGTKTHQADFSVAAEAIVQFMELNPDAVFRIVGDFDLTEYPKLERWRHVFSAGEVRRVVSVGLMPHDVMVRDQANCDVILAPLELGNPFCESKSELKFFEASLVGCPVIATANETFSRAMRDGALGYLAKNADEWLEALNSVYNDYGAALNKAKNAHRYVIDNYSQGAIAREAVLAYSSAVGADLTLIGSGAQKTVTKIGVIIPDFTGPSGGHRKIFEVCRAFEAKGGAVTAYLYGGRDASAVKADAKKYFDFDNFSVEAYCGFITGEDLVLCTQWRSAYDYKRFGNTAPSIYFVQDMEPMFYPVGSEYVRALSSYKGFDKIICYGEWVGKVLSEDVGVETQFIPFTLDHATYSAPATEGVRDIDILLFARPSQDRRCFELILEGLVQLKQRRPDIRIAFFGEDQYTDYGFAFENLGCFSDLNALAALYRRAKVGICYSPTNPSQLGYEMVACGACVVDVRIRYSELNFGGDAFVAYSDGTAEDMADICENLVDNPSDRLRRQELGYAFISDMPDDHELGRNFLRAADLL
jgi:glycosyltransferase involved in cell wall biosynthesis